MTTTPQPVPFASIDGGAQPFALGEDGMIYQLSSDEVWVQVRSLPVADISVAPPEDGFPGGRLWGVPATANPGGVWFRDLATGTFTRTREMADQVSAGAEGETWAARRQASPLRWDDAARTWTPENDAVQVDVVAVSRALCQWGLSGDGQALYLRPGVDGEWAHVIGAPSGQTMTRITTNPHGELACVTNGGGVFLLDEDDRSWLPVGDGSIAFRDICIRDRDATWALDAHGNAMDLGPMAGPAARPCTTQWDTEDPWDETKSTHLYIVNRAAQLVASWTDPRYAGFVTKLIQPMAPKAQAGWFRQGLCQGLYDADFVGTYNNPVLNQPTYKSHFYDPATGKNWVGETTPTALTNGVTFFTSSVIEYQHLGSRAGYDLGLALHYFTDLTQPMHAANFTYISSIPFGYHTDFETFMLQQQARVPQPSVTGFQPGSVNGAAALFTATATATKARHWPQVLAAYDYTGWKFSPTRWQQAVLPLLPSILDDAVKATAQLLYLYIGEVLASSSEAHEEEVATP